MKRIKKHSLVFVLFIIMGVFLKSCQFDKTFHVSAVSQNTGFENDLLGYPLFSIDGNTMVLAAADTIYLLRTNNLSYDSTSFYIRNAALEEPLIQRDFTKEVAVRQIGSISWEVFKVPMALRINDDIELWARYNLTGNPPDKRLGIIHGAEIRKQGPQHCIGSFSGDQKLLQQWIFEEQLQDGIFARVQNGFSLLLFRSTCWVFATEDRPSDLNMMIHFIHAQGFDNYSFRLTSASFNRCVQASINGLNVYKINMQHEIEFYDKIRMGEFNEDGNLWVQVLDVDKLLENKLLRYQGEFNESAHY